MLMCFFKGSQSFNVYNFVYGCYCRESMLSQIVDQARHIVVRRRLVQQLLLDLEGVVVDHLLLRFSISPSVLEVFAIEV